MYSTFIVKDTGNGSWTLLVKTKLHEGCEELMLAWSQVSVHSKLFATFYFPFRH